MYDAIVIGSRCAGAPTAMLLARKGRHVLLVDRATFPSDVLSGHSIQPAGVARLARWASWSGCGPPGAPFASPCGSTSDRSSSRVCPTPSTACPTCVCIRRTVLDALLVDAAAEAGAEVPGGLHREKEFVWDGGRVVGVRGRDASGAGVEERAAVVVGADGVHSDGARRRRVELPTSGRPPR